MGFLLPSHIDQGAVFGLLGIWHLINTLVSFVKFPNKFTHRTWFPVDRFPGTLRCVELWVLLVIVIAFLYTQLSHVIPDLHQGFIQAKHLQRFQHVTFGIFFLVYVLVALLSEGCSRLPLPDGALHSTFALGFLMELLVFHLGHHPGDTFESFVHMLMQIVLGFLVFMMFMELLFPYNFLVSISRCMLLTLKGSWFFHIGLIINFPSTFAPAGCVADPPGGGHFPVCGGGEEFMRAKSLQVLVFGWHVAVILVGTLVAYASLIGFHVGAVAKDHYQLLAGESKLDPIDELQIMTSGSELKKSLSKRRSYRGLATP